MKKALIAFLFLGFVFGFAATKSKKVKIGPAPTKAAPAAKAHTVENFDFLYGQWELLNSQGIKSRKPASLDDKSLNFVLEEDIYLESDAAAANAGCESGVEFRKFTKGQHRAYIKQVKNFPLLQGYFGSGKREGIWTGEVICKDSKKTLWSAALMTRRQLFLTSGSHVVELYRRDNVAPLRETFTDSDAEVSTE